MNDEERFWSKVEVGDCWHWTGATNIKGYGRFRYLGHNRFAHRVAYLLLVGDIPDGLQVDHLCRNRACVNPDHMELVTDLENIARQPANQNMNKPTCVHGHPLTGPNLYVSPTTGWRVCRTCRRAVSRAWKRKAGVR